MLRGRFYPLSMVGLLIATLCGSCSSGVASLHVDVVTDFLPQVEFDAIRVEVGSGAELMFVDHDVVMDDYLGGVRVTSVSMTGTQTFIRVGLLRFDEEVAFRTVTVPTTESSQAVTVVITRDCEDVVCAGGSTSSCLGGHCVDPRCTLRTPEFCPAAECSRDTDCAAAECAVARCAFGVCLADGSAADCPNGEFCDGIGGCQPILLGDCVGVSCLDGQVCVSGECVAPHHCDPARCEMNLTVPERCLVGECTDDGTCVGTTICTDDDDPCTVAVCAENGCEQVDVPDGTLCGGGDFCTLGRSQCQSGECVAPGPPCAGLECDETTEQCVGCVQDDDCVARPPVFGPATFGSECSEQGSAVGSRFEVGCVDGVCVEERIEVRRDVARSTAGELCGDGTWETVQPCMEYEGICSTDGTELATVYVSSCQRGSCVTNNISRSRPCTRPPPTISDCDAREEIPGVCEFPDMCATSGTQTNTLVTFDCEAGACVAHPRAIMEPCLRPPPSTSGCAPDTVALTSCGARGVCDLTGTLTEIVTSYSCGAGSCNAQEPVMTIRSCMRFTNGNECGFSGTCQSGVCEDCTDGIQNHGETDVDCGGPCSPCPTCSDGIQNQGETSIDCGGPCGLCA